MRRLYKYAWVALAGTLMAISCNKTMEEPASSEEALAPVTRTFTCVFPGADDPDAKVSIADDGKTAWEEGDEIMVHGGKDGAVFEKVTLTDDDISADGKKATIKVTIDGYDRTDSGVKSQYYAQYPADLVPTGGNMYYECCFQGTNDKLMAACDVDGKFVFYNLCGIISFKVTGDFDQYVFTGKNNETVAYDYYQVRVRDDGSGAAVNYHKPGNGYPSYTELKSITGSMTGLESTVYYICLPKGANFTTGFEIKFLKGGDIKKTVSTKSGSNVAIGKYLPLGDITSHLKTYDAPTTHDSSIGVPVDASGDLSATATANCYIVDPAKYAASSDKLFKFKAVKGNNSSMVLNTIKSAVILWETYNDATDAASIKVLEDVDYDQQAGEDPYIVFQMPDAFKAGNAVIAAKNAGGEIIWSWHIWVPATTVTAADYGIHTSGKNVMDRNLGALRVTEASSTAVIDITSVGLFYQWGRKDPFVGPSVISEGKYPENATVNGAVWTYGKTQLSLEESIKQPTYLARGYYDGSTLKNPDWCSTSDANLWGDSGSKSIYDPCPPGYRVPKRDETKPLWTKSDFTTQPGWEYDKDHYWFKIGSPVTVFPVVGFYDGTIKTTFRTIIWNAHSDDWTNEYGFSHYAAYARRVRYESSTLKQDRDSKSKSYGCAVRCVAE